MTPIFYFLSALSAYKFNTSAVPVPLLISRAVPLNTESCINNRTLFGIVWSCLLTTILCAWTAAHPNVPLRSKWKGRFNRLKLMLWMVVAPELVLAWAVRQYFAAREIRDEYNRSRPELPERRRWTLVHGYMLEMGGFTLVDPEDKDNKEGRSQVLTFDNLKRLLEDPKFKFPSITAADIADRSKGDTLLKLIAILQTTWFIVQCIACCHQGLALTELELITLALASLNVVTFAIWWHKPLGVQEPVKIYMNMERPMVKQGRGRAYTFRLSYHHVLPTLFGRFATVVFKFFSSPSYFDPIEVLAVLFIGIPVFLLYTITFPVFVLFPLGIISILRIIEIGPVPLQAFHQRGLLTIRIVASLQRFCYSSSFAVRFIGIWVDEILCGRSLGSLFGWFIFLPCVFIILLLFVILLTPFLTFFFLVSFMLTDVLGIITTSTVRPHTLHVPSFYAPATKSDSWSRMVVFAFFGVIFRGLHCIGWNFVFPSHSEQALWRGTSLAITIIPLIIAPIDFFLTPRLHNATIDNSCQPIERTAVFILDFVFTILLFIYVPTRFSLIVQAFTLLRHQPSSALVVVDGIKYIPHLYS